MQTQQIKIAPMLIQYRKGYTKEALYRTTTINNTHTRNGIKLLRALARLKKDKIRAAELGGYIAMNSSKPIKNVMSVIWPLSRDAFPLIESVKVERDGTTIKAPLYSMSTGAKVAERYTSVGLSLLGRTLLRHEGLKDIDDIQGFRSIVPYSLLAFHMPISTGHGSRTFPLNPEELFRLQLEMIRYGTPYLPDNVVNSIFRGFDVGEDYTVIMTEQSLASLYTKGVAYFTVVPKIVVSYDKMAIMLRAPQLRSNGAVLKRHLLEKNKKGGFKTFQYSNEIEYLGKCLKLNVINFNTSNPEEILEELENWKYIAYKQKSTFDTIITTDDDAYKKKLDDEKEIAIIQEEIESEIIKEAEKEVKDGEEIIVDTADFKESIYIGDIAIMDLDTLTKESVKKELISPGSDIQSIISGLDVIAGGQNATNIYNFELDVLPVYLELWRCINVEKDMRILAIDREIEVLKEQLKRDTLYEKVTREGVNTKIYELLGREYPEHKRIPTLLEYFKPEKEDILPEGFSYEEADIIFNPKSANATKYLNIALILFQRDKYAEEHIKTQAMIDALIAKKSDIPAIMQDIAIDLDNLISSGQFSRKSEVKFKVDDLTSIGQLEELNPTKRREVFNVIPKVPEILDRYELPVTLRYDYMNISKHYETNLYDYRTSRDFMALNVMNNEIIFGIYATKNTGYGEINIRPLDVKSLPIGDKVPLGDKFMGLFPLPSRGKEVWVFTDKNNVLIFNDVPTPTLNMNQLSMVMGAVIVGPEHKYIDVRTDNGFKRLDLNSEEIMKLRKSPNTVHMLPFGGTIMDMLPMEEDYEYTYLWDERLKEGTKKTDVFKLKQKRVRALSKKSISIEQAPITFAPHEEMYIAGLYIPDFRVLSAEEQRNTYKKHFLIPEDSLNIPDSQNARDTLKALYDTVIKPEGIREYNKVIRAYSSDAYANFDLEKTLIQYPDLIPLLDKRLTQ